VEMPIPSGDELSDYIQIQGELFEAVQNAEIFADSKMFPDYCPIEHPALIYRRYQNETQQPGFNLRRFVLENFIREGDFSRMRAHIHNMWAQLYRENSNTPQYSTRIPLPYPYVVPGGRFQEIYYWDSYFTFLGLVISGHVDWVENMVANFAHLIDLYNHVPNGNRVYYLSRSQPPFFCCMLQLLEAQNEPPSYGSVVVQYLPQLQTEYQYWMSGQNEFTDDRSEIRRVVRLGSGQVLNRYWDNENIPRQESYREDISTYRDAPLERQENIYRNIRAAAESGWDFSSRWLGGWNLSSIRTTEIIPIDLNCLLYNMELQLAEHSLVEPDREFYQNAANTRRNAIWDYCWDEDAGWFFDYCWTEGQRSPVLSLAGAFPLFSNLVERPQADRIERRIQRDFLKAGGVVTTLNQTGQQWDYPNGWAPLQWVVVKGLLNYGYDDLARRIAERFVGLASRVYGETGKMMEKYDVCDVTKQAGGGEYPTQDGFGWTNGTVEALINLFNLDQQWGS
jgi:alpha,alpha-trehalase